MWPLNIGQGSSFRYARADIWHRFIRNFDIGYMRTSEWFKPRRGFRMRRVGLGRAAPYALLQGWLAARWQNPTCVVGSLGSPPGDVPVWSRALLVSCSSRIGWLPVGAQNPTAWWALSAVRLDTCSPGSKPSGGTVGSVEKEEVPLPQNAVSYNSITVWV